MRCYGCSLLLILLLIQYQVVRSCDGCVESVEIVYRKLFLDCILIENAGLFQYSSSLVLAKALAFRGLQTSIVNLQIIHKIILEKSCMRPLLVHLRPEKTLKQSLSFSRWHWLIIPTWLVFSRSSTPFQEATLEDIRDQPRAINSRILVTWMKDGSFEEWWKISRNHSWERVPWSFRGCLPGRSGLLQGVTFRIGIGIENAFTRVHFFENGTVKHIGRYFGRILQLFQEYLKFNTEYVYKTNVGNLNMDPNYTGILNLLIRKEIDLAGVSLTRTSKRSNFINYFFDLNLDSIEIVIKAPDSLDIGWKDYIGIFDKWLWNGIGITILVAFFIDGLFFYTLKNNYVKDRDFWEPSESGLLMLGTICCAQSQPRVLKSCAGRIFLLTICGVSLIISNSYNSFLTAIVAIEKFDLPFKTLDELAESKKFGLGVRKPGALYEMFLHSKNNMLARLYKGPMANPNARFLESNKMGLQELCHDPFFAFVSHKFVLSEFKHDCNLITIPERLFFSSTTMAMTFNNTYLRYFDEIIRFGQESGIFKKLQRSHLMQVKGSNNINNDIKFESVYIEDVYFQCFILLLGLVFALSLLFIEYLYKYFTLRKAFQFRNEFLI